jgi:hypothetical protein
MHGEEEEFLQGLVRKLQRKRPLGRARRRWDVSIKFDR